MVLTAEDLWVSNRKHTLGGVYFGKRYVDDLRVVTEILFNQQTRSLSITLMRLLFSCLSYPTCWSFTKELDHAAHQLNETDSVGHKLFGGYCGQDHLLPFRTEKLSCPAPMVLGHCSRESRSPPIYESLAAILQWGFLRLRNGRLSIVTSVIHRLWEEGYLKQWSFWPLSFLLATLAFRHRLKHGTNHAGVQTPCVCYRSKMAGTTDS